MNKKKVFYNVLSVIFGLIAVGCVVYLGLYYYTNNRDNNALKELAQYIHDDLNMEEEEPFTEVNGTMVQTKFAEIYEMNTDFVGWLTIDDSKVDYPVMMTMEDEEFYLHRNFDKEYSSGGTLFVDTDCSLTMPTTNIIIYGHNMKAGTMFHELLNYQDQEYYDSHQYITFDTIYGDNTYQVISAFFTEIYPEDSTEFQYYKFIHANNAEEFNEYLRNIKMLSVVDTSSVKAQYGDTFITLSTCSYHTDDGRFVVVAKKIQEEEESN